MGQKLQITIDSIRNGMQSFEDFPSDGQFVYSRGIDPDFVGEDNVGSTPTPNTRKSGLITPVPYADQSSTSVDDAPIALITGFEVPTGSTREMFTVLI